MVKEAYVSFEVAKLLKEKGFNGECNYYYRCHDEALIKYFPNPGTDDNRFHCTKTWIKKHANRNHVEYILAPTHQMARDWLMEEKGIYLDVFIDDDSEMPWTYNIHKELRDGTTECVCHHHGNYYPLRTGYEEAVEAALIYTLEHLLK